MNEQGENDFKWQSGYGWFSVGPKDLAIAKGYLAKQKEHHQTTSFQDEYRQFLRKYEVDFDERYLWD